jgi:fatty-acyl-CoA synthase
MPVISSYDAPVTTLPALLARQAAVRPGAQALRCGDLALDYAALHTRSLHVADWLQREAGVEAGDRVAWLGANHADLVTLLFALARLGAMLVPLNFRLAHAEWLAVLRDCTPRCLIADFAWCEAALALARDGGLPVHRVEALTGTAQRNVPAEPASADLVRPDAPVLLVYTSGTTGEPKGAVHTQANLLANMAAASEVQALEPSDRVLTVLPLFHVGGLCIQTLPALYAGASVLLHPRFEPGAMLQAVARDRPSLTLVVPAVMKALIEHPDWPGADLGSLRAAWAGSSTLPDALVEAFHARGVPVCNVYGATETGPFSIALGPRHARSHMGSCGWPAPGVQVRLDAVQAEAGRAASTRSGAMQTDGVGEVLLCGPAVVSHYWPDRPARDAQGWLRTGDLALQASDGSYRIVGRAKDMIISGGENIYPAEIENLLAAHPAVAEVAVIGLPDPRWGEAVVAVLVTRPGAAAGDAELLAWLGEHIARYKLPRRIVRLPELPRTALGKVQKGRLLAHPALADALKA